MEGSSVDSKNYGPQGFSFLWLYHALTYQYVTSQKCLLLVKVIINNFYVNTMATVWYLVLITYEIKKLFRTGVSAHSLFLLHKIRKLYDWVFHTVIFFPQHPDQIQGWPWLFLLGHISQG
jgi:hypothetical protein